MREPRRPAHPTGRSELSFEGAISKVQDEAVGRPRGERCVKVAAPGVRAMPGSIRHRVWAATMSFECSLWGRADATPGADWPGSARRIAGRVSSYREIGEVYSRE